MIVQELWIMDSVGLTQDWVWLDPKVGYDIGPRPSHWLFNSVTDPQFMSFHLALLGLLSAFTSPACEPKGIRYLIFMAYPSFQLSNTFNLDLPGKEVVTKYRNFYLQSLPIIQKSCKNGDKNKGLIHPTKGDENFFDFNLNVNISGPYRHTFELILGHF